LPVMVLMQLCVIIQLMKSEVDDHRCNVDHLVECRQLLVGSDSAGVAASTVANSIADTCKRYDTLASDVDCRLSCLSELEPRWKHFDESICELSHWLKAQHDQVPDLRNAAQGPAVSQASVECQVC